MSDEEESSEYSYEDSSEGSAEEHVDVSLSTGANHGIHNEEDESDDSGSEGLEGEDTEDEYSEKEYSEISAPEDSGVEPEDEEEPPEVVYSVDFRSPAPPRDSQEEVESTDKDSALGCSFSATGCALAGLYGTCECCACALLSCRTLARQRDARVSPKAPVRSASTCRVAKQRRASSTNWLGTRMGLDPRGWRPRKLKKTSIPTSASLRLNA